MGAAIFALSNATRRRRGSIPRNPSRNHHRQCLQLATSGIFDDVKVIRIKQEGVAFANQLFLAIALRNPLAVRRVKELMSVGVGRAAPPTLNIDN
jgi:hypothetical protein